MSGPMQNCASWVMPLRRPLHNLLRRPKRKFRYRLALHSAVMPELNTALRRTRSRVCLLDMSWSLRAGHLVWGLLATVMSLTELVAQWCLTCKSSSSRLGRHATASLNDTPRFVVAQGGYTTVPRCAFALLGLQFGWGRLSLTISVADFVR